MKTVLKIFFVFGITISVIILSSCKHSTEPEDNSLIPDTGRIVVYKPNIYLYPQRKCSINVKIKFPAGGSVIQSIPDYERGWKVEVEPNGKINGKYNYLFYESSNPDKFQMKTGWIIEKNALESFFSKNLTDAGFNKNETNDFIEYWIPRLTDYSYYIVFPQTSRVIDQVIKLNIDPKPESILRLFYVIKGTETKNIRIQIPEIPKFKRSGYTAAEWGVILK